MDGWSPDSGSVMNVRPVPARVPRAFRAVAACAGLVAALAPFAGPLVPPATGSPEDGGVQAAIPPPALRVGFPISTGGAPFSQPPVVVDLDLDGRPEVLAVDDNGAMYAFDANGAPFGGFTRNIGGTPSGPVAVADIDCDGVPEIVTVATNGKIRIFTNEGAIENIPFELPWAPVGGPVLTELDRSGRLGIVIVTADGTLYAIRPEGGLYPGFPVAGSAVATSGPFAYVGPDNFPRIGYLGAVPDRAQIFFTYAERDTQASVAPGVPFSGATPVAGARALFGLPDADHVYVMARHGSLRRLDPDVFNGGTAVTPLAGLPDDSVFVQPSLVDVTGDLVPELAVLGIRGDTLGVYLLDGASGSILAGFPRRYLGAQPVGGIVCVDVGDNNAAELIFNRGGDKISCVRSNGTEAWTINDLPSVAPPAVGDMDNDGGIDMAVVTTTGLLYVYTLGNAGLGPRTIEWSTQGGSATHEGRHRLRDRAVFHPFWPPSITPANTFTTRPVVGVWDPDGRPDVLWSDYASGKTFGFNAGAGAVTGMPQAYAQGAVLDGPAIGDITGDGVFESVQSTSTGRIVWGDSTGVLNNFLVDSNRILSPPSLADLNADGVLDVIVGSSSGRLYAVEVVGTPSVLPGFPVTTAGAISLPAALGDVNGDAQTDIVVVGGPRTIYAYPRTGVAALTGWPRQFASGNTLFQPILVPVAGQTGLCASFGRATGVDSVVAHLVGANGAPLAGWPKRLTNALDLISGPVAGDFDNNGSVDLAFATGGDSIVVFNPAGNRVLARHFASPGNLELFAMVDLDLDERPELVFVSDLSTLVGMRFNGLTVRSFTRQLITVEPGAPPAFGDIGNDGVLDMAASDLGQPILYSWGPGSWKPNAAPWPMKGHDRYRTHAFSGPTVVGVDDPAPAPPARGAGIARAIPNPARGTVALTHSRPLAGAYEALLFDVRGRLVRTLGRGEAPAAGAPVSWAWDGRDEAGALVPAGIYFYRVRDAAGTMQQKVVRLR